MAKETLTIDAKGLTLGRLASKVAILLRGKHQVTFAPYLDPEVTVKVTNAKEVTLTGTKLDTKTYWRHSGYPGGRTTKTAKQLSDKKGYADLIKKAVRGMLPENRLRAKILNRLIIEE
jgi:large subunit ribosomal protein L13